ncbi:MAG TPA: thioredoxin domain-containing protein [Microthrixaceae bacterium]|nr:thioredoxin domain-containing protein [Microthrixaceae bacterium]
MANRLANETSPYLRQHAENPVDWYPWGDEAFAAARERDVPILLSIGYSSCHWCHVMAHESFEDPDTAAEMNRSFVNVKVDREERPDVDAVYMEATQAMTGAGGWPMTVFLTPEGEPFYCGTYFPAEPRGGQPTFRQLLGAIELAWRDQRDAVREQAGRLVDAIRTTASAPADAGLPDPSTLDEATMSMLSVHDARFGGFGTAPKFPQAMAVDHLLRHHARTGSRAALEAAVITLDAMASGGIHDHLGGGFSRYSVDERWLVPHFEKMLYDNVLLARAYLHAWQLTDEDRFLQVLEETLGYVLDVLSHPDGGRYSAEDADSLPPGAPEGARPEEGAFYLWTPEQVAEALQAAGLGEVTEQALEWWGIRPGGNFEGRSIPNRLHARGGLARPPAIEAARTALERARRQRPRPGLDDKVLTEWNALAVATLAEAAAATGREDWRREAVATAEFLCEHLRRPSADGGRPRWLRSWQADGGARHLAYASDHGALVDGFLCLYEATGELRWLQEARDAAESLLELFWDTEGSVWSTGDDAEELVTRPKDLTDGATPSANSLAAVGLLRLEAHTGEGRYGEHARQILRNLGGLTTRHPLAFGHLLWAVGLHALGVTEVVVTGDRPELVREVHRRFTPHTVLAWGEPGDGPLWEGREASGAEGRAYVCRDHVCAAPSGTAQELREQLAAATP